MGLNKHQNNILLLHWIHGLLLLNIPLICVNKILYRSFSDFKEMGHTVNLIHWLEPDVNSFNFEKDIFRFLSLFQQERVFEIPSRRTTHSIKKFTSQFSEWFSFSAFYPVDPYKFVNPAEKLVWLRQFDLLEIQYFRSIWMLSFVTKLQWVDLMLLSFWILVIALLSCLSNENLYFQKTILLCLRYYY